MINKDENETGIFDNINKVNNNSRNFSGDYFSQLASRVNKTANSDEAKKTRKKLLVGGGIGIGISFLILLGGMIMFIAGPIASFNSWAVGEIKVGFIIGGMVMYILGGAGVSVSTMAIRAGLGIVITGVSSKIVDSAKYCPKCGDKVDNNELFCNLCGENLRKNKLCSCGEQNDFGDEYCRKCGTKL